MKLRNLVMDTSDLSFEELDALIKELRKVRERKGEARARHQNPCTMVETMREANMTFCSRYTGEILNPQDWVVYDSLTHATYPPEKDE